MAPKEATIVLTVDFACSSCINKIKKVLRKYRERYQIQEEKYDEKNNTITISGHFCPKELSKKLCCKAGNCIKSIKIIDKKPTPPCPPPTKPKCPSPPKHKCSPPPPTSKPPICCGQCHEGCKRPQPCYCGCGGTQWTCYRRQPCYCGCGGTQSTCYRRQPCHCGCGGTQSMCYKGWGRPLQPCYCGCGGSRSQCYRRYGRSSYGSPCGLFNEENPNSCIVM